LSEKVELRDVEKLESTIRTSGMIVMSGCEEWRGRVVEAKGQASGREAEMKEGW
jgi:hypothetical protein